MTVGYELMVLHSVTVSSGVTSIADKIKLWYMKNPYTSCKRKPSLTREMPQAATLEESFCPKTYSQNQHVTCVPKELLFG